MNIIDEIVGLNIKEAAKIAKEHGYSFRVVISNGIPLLVSQESVANRVNVKVDKNEVIEVISLG